MRFALKLLANLTEPRGGDASDRLISAMTRLAPSLQVTGDVMPRMNDHRKGANSPC